MPLDFSRGRPFPERSPPQPGGARAARECAARRPAAAARARRGGRPGASDRPGRRDRADGGGGQARLDDPVGAAGHRQDDDRAPARRRGRHALRRHFGGLLGRRRPQEGVRRGARASRRLGKQTLLFVDEIHRFNRAQQDGFLPYVEDGTVVLVGATTENPSFELNAALLSPRPGADPQPARRARRSCKLLDRAEALMGRPLPLTAEARDALVATADGDGRFLLNQAETLFSIEIDEAARARPSWPPCSTAASRSTTRTARAITTSSRRCTKRSAAPTRRRRSTISRGC